MTSDPGAADEADRGAADAMRPDREADRAKHAASFDEVADVYEAARPGYPAEAVDWLVPREARVVVDVGAGTGKFTRALVAPGRRVVAVDPSPRMLSQLSLAVPDVAVQRGSGERIPLRDGSADALVFAQAWHWVDPQAASVEVARVLRGGGTLGLVWNLRDERVDWVRELGVAMRADGDSFTADLGEPVVAAPFSKPERADFAWSQRLDRRGMLDLVRSRSYFAVLDEVTAGRVLDNVAALLDHHPQTSGRHHFELPYVTVCFRYRRP